MLLAQKEDLENDRVGVMRTQDRVLREFQFWLKQKDPGLGDLRKVLNKQQEFLWVHRDYEKEYWRRPMKLGSPAYLDAGGSASHH